MGVFSVDLAVGSPVREQFITVQAMVDTGAIYTMLPEDLLDYLGVKRLESDIFEMADDRPVEYWIGSATVRLQERQLPVPVIFANPGNTPLVGATTLEILRLMVDPINRQLIPARRIRARMF